MAIMKLKVSLIASTLASAVFLFLVAYSAAHEAKAPEGGTPIMGSGMMGDGMAASNMDNQDMPQGMMGQGMLNMPRMDPARGRKLFADKGCVVCHSVNGVGGEDAPPLDASTMERGMNPFEFAAKMWRGADAMLMLQREELGEKIEFTGDELADIIAFVHHPAEQQNFSMADVPPRMRELISHGHGEEEPDHHDEEEEAGHKD